MIFKIIIPVFIFVFLLLLFIRIFFKKIRQDLFEKLDSRFGIENLILYSTGANFFGRKSKGMLQVRGNGALALTNEGIFFLMYSPEEEFLIPYGEITLVDIRKSFLGKSVFKPLLHVEFNFEGGVDEVAWYVQDPEEWVAKIEEIKNGKGF